MLQIRQLTTAAADFWSQLESLLAWDAVSDERVASTVKDILHAVRVRGDAAVVEYTNRFDRMQVAGMKRDFSWERSAREYVDLYRKVARVKAVKN